MDGAEDGAVRTCPHCGSGIPELSRFSKMQRQIIEVVRKRPGLTIEEITQAVYGSDPDGGPSSNVVSVHIRNINRRMRDDGLKIGSVPRNRDAGIHIQKLEET